MNWETLACFGDSITIGARTYLGYPEYAGDFLQQKISNSWNVLNIACSGYTACDLSRKITAEGNHIASYHPDFFTLLIGTNDVKKATPLNDFRIAYDLSVLKIRLLTQHNNGLLISIPSFRKGLKHPYKYEMNEEIVQYNEVIKEIGKKYDLEVLDLLLEEAEFFDGIHLNTKGSTKVGRQIANRILKEKGLDQL
ncbi:MAG: SGNH/GDSL hydrolase family protein [Bacteroidota bacterium]